MATGKDHGKNKKERYAALAIKYAGNAAGYAQAGNLRRAKILLLDIEHHLDDYGIQNREDVQEALAAAWEIYFECAE